MATHRIPILGAASFPTDTAGNVFFEPYSIKATNDVWKRLVCVFNDTATRIGLAGGFTVPKNYAGGAKIIVVWTSTATSGNCRWEFDYRTVAGDDSASLDQAGTEESAGVTDAAPTAAHNRLEASISLTAGNLSGDEEVEFELFRDGADAADTMAAAALLFSLMFEYVDV